MPWPDMADRMLGVAVRTFAHSGQDGESLVQYIPKAGSPYTITAVFDKAHVSVDPDTGAPISSTNPVLGVQRSQLFTADRFAELAACGRVDRNAEPLYITTIGAWAARPDATTATGGDVTTAGAPPPSCGSPGQPGAPVGVGAGRQLGGDARDRRLGISTRKRRSGRRSRRNGRGGRSGRRGEL